MEEDRKQANPVEAAPGLGIGPAAEKLVPQVYTELRRLAGARMAGESPGHTLQATALVHEAWLRLASAEPQNWHDRRYFLAAAAEAMRRILVEHARRKRQVRRGGQWQRVELEASDLPAALPDEKILLVDEELEELAKLDPVEAEVIKLHYFGGLGHAEAGEVLGLSERTVKRYCAFAKAWLYRRIRERLGA